ncbi:uncharacterized protein ARMOST_15178 [Armillaria ostoyae]|uniref:Uncharacterized protein n=1 Tax=Armillaria ostoyae TaxID=47428 RepID=A0A284RSP4_ARMOS|nr:uncharacterized protein ARMOST_15178 [Armillaria ostoyae]
MHRKWSAPAYDHFLPEVMVAWNTKNRRWQQVFICKRDLTIKIHWAFHDNGTANMICHARLCKTADCNNDDESKLIQSSLMSFMQGSTYTPGQEEYRGILRMFNKDVQIPSADTLSCDVKDVYTLVKKRVAELFQNVDEPPGSVCSEFVDFIH